MSTKTKKIERVVMLKRRYDPATGDQTPISLTEARARIKHLEGEVTMLNLSITGLQEMSRGFDGMKVDIDAIAVYLGDNMAFEISQGYHAGRTVGAIVVGYLQRMKAAETELKRWTALARGYSVEVVKLPHWVRRFFGYNTVRMEQEQRAISS